MSHYSLTHLPDNVLARDLAAAVRADRASTARLIAHIAEFDRRRLYVPAGYPSMKAYCIGELRLSEDSAAKRIQAARPALDFPAILDALADGRLHLTAVVRLAPHLRPDNAAELIALAAHRTTSEIAELLAARFPRQDVPTTLGVIDPSPPDGEQVSKPVGLELGQQVPEPVAAARPRIEPLSPERLELRLTIGRPVHTLIEQAQRLLGRSGTHELEATLERALKLLVQKLEKQKFGAAAKPRSIRPARQPKGRHIPTAVKREVRERDGDQCTFVSQAGHRCEARLHLEFDHVKEFARGGETTAANLRLRCRPHNQYTAECSYGAGFMKEKREAAKRRAASARSAATDPDRDITPWLRQLGFRRDDIRRGIALCDDAMPDASLEERIKFAASRLVRIGRKLPPPMVPAPA